MNNAKSSKYIANSLIGIAIMLLFRFLPLEIPGITDTGMQVIGIFLGTLYLWMTVGTLWPSLMCAALLGLSSYQSMNYILCSFLGNPTMMLVFFIMIMSGALSKYGITGYLADALLRAKAAAGHPWVLTAFICTGSYLMSVFINPFTPIFIFTPILTDLFAEVGYSKKDLMAKCLMVLVPASSVIGYAVPPFLGTPLVLIDNFNAMTEGVRTIETGRYFIASFTVGLIMVLVLLAVTRFILRPDASALEKYAPSGNPAVLESKQKLLLAGFAVMICFMLLPSLLPETLPGITALRSAGSGIPLLAAAVLSAVPYGDGRLLDIQKVMNESMNWNTIFLCGAAILLSSALTDESTGLTVCLKTVLGAAFANVSPTKFLLLMVLLCVLITNFCNSLVIATLMLPVISSYCAVTGADGVPIAVMVIFSSLMTALLTPAASPFAAVMHGNRNWLDSRDIYRIAGVYVIAEALVLVAILPLSSVI